MENKISIPKFELGELVINTVTNSYYTISEININQKGIFYILENGSVVIELEEKYLAKY